MVTHYLFILQSTWLIWGGGGGGVVLGWSHDLNMLDTMTGKHLLMKWCPASRSQGGSVTLNADVSSSSGFQEGISDQNKTLQKTTRPDCHQTKTYFFYKLILYVTFTITTVSFHTGVHIQHQHVSVLIGYTGYSNSFFGNKVKRLRKRQDTNHKSIIHLQHSAIIIVSMVKFRISEVQRFSNVFHKVHDRIFQKEAGTTHNDQKWVFHNHEKKWQKCKM